MTPRSGAPVLALLALLVGAAAVTVLGPASAASISVGSGDVGALQTVGSTHAYELPLAAHILIPAGEHLELSYARVLVALPGTSTTGGLLAPATCDATTDAATGPVADIGTILAHTSTDAGYSAGYGSATAPTSVVVPLTVTQCVGGASTSLPFHFASGQLSQQFLVQALVGSGAGHVIQSSPVTVTLVDPEYVAPFSCTDCGLGVSDMTPADPPTADNPSPQSSVSYIITDAGGDVSDQGTPTGYDFPVTDFPAGSTSTADTYQVTTLKPLPAGSLVQFNFQDSNAATGDGTLVTAPPFNVPANQLYGATHVGKTVVPPALAFQVTLSQPGSTTGATGTISMDITLHVPDSYFAATGTTPAKFRLAAFTAKGSPEPAPVRTSGPTAVTIDGVPSQQYTFHITRFSSYVGVATLLRGGGGGGAPDSSAPVVVPPVSVPAQPSQPDTAAQNPSVPGTPVTPPAPDANGSGSTGSGNQPATNPAAAGCTGAACATLPAKLPWGAFAVAGLAIAVVGTVVAVMLRRKA